MIVLLILAYNRKFSPTLQLYGQVSSLSTIKNEEKLNQDIASVETDLKLVNKLLGKERHDVQSVNKDVVHKVSRIKDSLNVELVSMPNIHTIDDGSFKISTHRIILSGGFQNQLKVINEFEHHLKGVKVPYINFYLWEDRRKKTQELRSEIHLKSYEKK